MVRKFSAWVMFFALCPLALAQVVSSTRGGGGSIVVGAEASAFKPDSIPPYLGGHVVGPGFFFDVNLQPKWGAEGEARWMRWHGTGGQTQSDYLIGPRYRIYRWHRVSLWGKFVAGAGVEKFPSFGSGSVGNGSYFAYAPGGTLDYQVTRHIDVRGDYEYQFWPSAPNLGPSFPNSGMNPSGFTIGIGYRLINAH